MLIQQEYILTLTIYSISLLCSNSLPVYFKEFQGETSHKYIAEINQVYLPWKSQCVDNTCSFKMTSLVNT